MTPNKLNTIYHFTVQPYKYAGFMNVEVLRASMVPNSTDFAQLNY